MIPCFFSAIAFPTLSAQLEKRSVQEPDCRLRQLGNLIDNIKVNKKFDLSVILEDFRSTMSIDSNPLPLTEKEQFSNYIQEFFLIVFSSSEEVKSHVFSECSKYLALLFNSNLDKLDSFYTLYALMKLKYLDIKNNDSSLNKKEKILGKIKKGGYLIEFHQLLAGYSELSIQTIKLIEKENSEYKQIELKIKKEALLS